MGNGRKIPNTRWEEAENKLREACTKKNITPDPRSYQNAVNRGWNYAVKAILDGTFIEEEWLETPSQRHKRCVQEFKDILRANKIRAKSYRRFFGHRIRDGARLIYLGQDLDVEYWTKKKALPSRDEAYEIISRLCIKEGFAIAEYQIKTRRYLKNFRRHIQNSGLDRLDIIKHRWMSMSLDPDRDPVNIRKKAETLLDPERTHGLSQLDFGNSFKSLVKCFYPEGLKGLNASLGLSQIEHVPEKAENRHKNKEVYVESKIKRLERKIAAIHQALDPEYLKNITDELKILASHEEVSANNLPEQMDASGRDDEYCNIEEVLLAKIKAALIVPDGYLYFKRWSLAERIWFKIGITNDPSRRDKEQNVLPVPSETLKVVKLSSMEQARAVESVIHKTLSGRLVRGAKNKELFELSGQEYRAVAKALGELERLCLDMQ